MAVDRLTLFLLVPLEAMHAWICHVSITRGLAETAAPPLSKDLVRGIGIDDILRTLAAPLLAAASAADRLALAAATLSRPQTTLTCRIASHVAHLLGAEHR